MLVISVLEGLDVMDLAAALVSACPKGSTPVKRLLARAKDASENHEVRELLDIILGKIKHLEDQTDGDDATQDSCDPESR